MESAAAGLVEDTLTPDDQLWVGKGGMWIKEQLPRLAKDSCSAQRTSQLAQRTALIERGYC